MVTAPAEVVVVGRMWMSKAIEAPRSPSNGRGCTGWDPAAWSRARGTVLNGSTDTTGVDIRLSRVS